MAKVHHCIYKGGSEGKPVYKDECYLFCGATDLALSECLKKCKPPWDLPCPVCYSHFGEKVLTIPGCMITTNNRCESHQDNEIDKRLTVGFAERYGLDPLEIEKSEPGNGQFECAVFGETISEEKCKGNIATCATLDCDCEKVKALKTETLSSVGESEKTEAPAVEASEWTMTCCDRLSPAKGVDTNDEELIASLMEEMQKGQKQPIRVRKIGLCDYQILDEKSLAIWLAARSLQIKQIGVVVEEECITSSFEASCGSDAGEIAKLMACAGNGSKKIVTEAPVSDKNPEAVSAGRVMPTPNLDEKSDEGSKEAAGEGYYKKIAKEAYERGNPLEIALVIEYLERKFKLNYLRVAEIFGKSHAWPCQRTSILKLDASILADFNPNKSEEQRPAFSDLMVFSQVKSRKLQIALYPEMKAKKIKGNELKKWLLEKKAFDAPFDSGVSELPWISMLSLGWFPVMAELSVLLCVKGSEKKEQTSPPVSVKEFLTAPEEKIGLPAPALEERKTDAFSEYYEILINSLVQLNPAQGSTGERPPILFDDLITSMAVRLINGLCEQDKGSLRLILNTSEKRQGVIELCDRYLAAIKSLSNRISAITT